MIKPEQTTDFIEASLDNVPEELKERPQWVCWVAKVRKTKNGEAKIDKLPYDPRTDKRASTTDLATWLGCKEAFDAYKAGPYHGVGFVFSSGDPYTGIDLDNCRDAETGVLDAWAHAWIERFSEGYIEASPSGTGLHIIVRAKTPHNGKRGNVEVYSVERFFAITGQVIA